MIFQFSNESKVENGVLFVDKEAIKKIVLEDENIKSCEVEDRSPGESVPHYPVKDVIEPAARSRVKGGIFPGVISKGHHRWHRQNPCSERFRFCHHR